MQFRSVGHATTAASASEPNQSQLRVGPAALKAGSASRFSANALQRDPKGE